MIVRGRIDECDLDELADELSQPRTTVVPAKTRLQRRHRAPFKTPTTPVMPNTLVEHFQPGERFES